MEQQAVWLGWNKGCVKDSERDRAGDTVREEPAGQALIAGRGVQTCLRRQ